ncbi:uncharacterized protein B0I36DRAFT_434483 [Microdochium trichocladiopsis]|uniref:Actin-like ATPase domain-containing protein n=1 Tax=Microdochium trichocladiopsis TaxID=1682393 RepID=A0A9P8Y0B7_9PEZI|nr:uncharacterized protein B0I36DRAFT_434483 [Microdochium trichocladiopsis]KAH7024913.1 hypothetical protein B0I36DRAFT_434483 [Microdochium trichocladiopsis]
MAQPPRTAVLSIDLGSTSLRAALLELPRRNEPHAQIWHRVLNPNHEGHYIRFKAYEWPIMFDLGALNSESSPRPVWQRRHVVASPSFLSAKYSMYFLAKAKEMQEQYCVIGPQFPREHPGLEKILNKGMLELFTAVKVVVDRLLEQAHLRIGRVALSIPSQWDQRFQTVYENLISSVFHVPVDQIAFVKEVEAIAHYMFKDERSYLHRRKRAYDQERVIFIDLGGHSTRIAKRMPGRRGRDLPAQALKDLAAQINAAQRGVIGPDRRQDFDFMFREGAAQSLTLPHRTIRNCFKEAFKRPLAAIMEQVNTLASGKGGLLVLSGGSSLIGCLQNHVRDLCLAVDLPHEPIFVETDDREGSGHKVFAGAGYAVAQGITARMFMAQGAAFALQRKLGSEDEFTQLLLHEDQQQASFDFRTSGKDDWVIICDPLFGSRPGVNAPDDGAVRYGNAYDVAVLGKLRRGTWKIDMSWHDPKSGHKHAIFGSDDHHKCESPIGNLCVQIRLWYGGRKPRGQPDKKNEFLKTLYTNVYMEYGSNCAFFDIEDDNKRTLANICEPFRKFNPNSDESESDSDESLQRPKRRRTASRRLPSRRGRGQRGRGGRGGRAAAGRGTARDSSTVKDQPQRAVELQQLDQSQFVVIASSPEPQPTRSSPHQADNGSGNPSQVSTEEASLQMTHVGTRSRISGQPVPLANGKCVADDRRSHDATRQTTGSARPSRVSQRSLGLSPASDAQAAQDPGNSNSPNAHNLHGMHNPAGSDPEDDRVFSYMAAQYQRDKSSTTRGVEADKGAAVTFPSPVIPAHLQLHEEATTMAVTHDQSNGTSPSTPMSSSAARQFLSRTRKSSRPLAHFAQILCTPDLDSAVDASDQLHDGYREQEDAQRTPLPGHSPSKTHVGGITTILSYIPGLRSTDE